MRGIRAEGGFELDFEWQDSYICALTVRSLVGRECHLQLPLSQDAAIVDGMGGMAEGALAECLAQDGRLDFNTTAGSNYELTYDTHSAIAYNPDIHSANLHSTKHLFFDLSGRRLAAPPTRGVYVNDGKRMVVK